MPEKRISIFRPTAWSIILLLLLTILFFWKILLTRQFSLLMEEEGVRQTFSWLSYLVASIRQGTLPLWDPYTGAGSSFPAEMQTGAFNPLNLFLALLPLKNSGMFAVQSYHQWFAFVHFLGACFMFALVRELGLSRFSALVSGVCFALGGFIIHAPWPHMYGSAIWLPLIFLFLLRALNKDSGMKKGMLYASCSGLFLGLSVLAGGLHLVMMQAIVVITAVIYAAFQRPLPAERHTRRSLLKPVLLCATVLVVGFCAGAVQLFPSMEYSGLAYRWIGSSAGAIAADSKIPYFDLKNGLAPHSFLGLLFFTAFGGSGEALSPYIGVFPLLAALIGIVKCWNNLWVRYLTGLAVIAFFYSLGERSLLHGVLYATVPYLWIAREANRILYLAGFALPILAAFGIETLLYKPVQKSAWIGFNRVTAGIVLACAAALAVSVLFGHPQINPWIALSIVVILASYGLFQYILRGRNGLSTQVLIMALILFDLSAFDWEAKSKMAYSEKERVNHYARLMSCRGAVDFLKSRPGPYRLQIDDSPKPNIGHSFQIPTINGTGVTALRDKSILGAYMLNQLNARYIMRPASAAAPGAVYQDASWKIYVNPEVYPAAWVVHEASHEPTIEGLMSRIESRQIDFKQTATLDAPMNRILEPRADGATESAVFRVYTANRLELDVQAQGRGLLVLSEIFYPGWYATVNGNSESIYKVNGILRGVVVPKGQSRVILQYKPMSIRVGGIISLIAFACPLLACAFHWRKRTSLK